MNFRGIYVNGVSKCELEEILFYLESHPKDFSKIFDLIFDKDEKIAFRSAWTVEKVAQRHFDWFTVDFQEKIYQLVLSTQHAGIHRLCISILTNFPNPSPLPVDLLNALYDWMILPKYSIGVQSLSMKLLHKFVKDDPDLLREFIYILTDTDDADVSSAFFASRKNILKHYK